jgi:hypothetical protein
VFVGLTLRRNGSYKEGRLLVFECDLPYYLSRLIANIQRHDYIDTQDAELLPRKKENKELLLAFSNLHKQQPIEFGGVELTPEQHQVASINIGHAFGGKEGAKHKIIEKVLGKRMEEAGGNRKKLDYPQLIQRCCFSGNLLGEEEVNHCPACDLFGIRDKGDQCVVCLQRMLHY